MLAIIELVALYRAADAMLVTALRDGMNLVAKEFVASRVDDDGVLILSEFAGTSAELEARPDPCLATVLTEAQRTQPIRLLLDYYGMSALHSGFVALQGQAC